MRLFRIRTTPEAARVQLERAMEVFVSNLYKLKAMGMTIPPPPEPAALASPIIARSKKEKKNS